MRNRRQKCLGKRSADIINRIKNRDHEKTRTKKIIQNVSNDRVHVSAFTPFGNMLIIFTYYNRLLIKKN